MTSATGVPAAPVPSETHAADPKASASRARAWPAGASPVPPPAAAVPADPPEQVTVPNGTELVVRLTESLSSDLNEKGDTFIASLANPVMIGDRVVIPEEAGVEGKVVDVHSAGRFSGRPKLVVEMTRLTYNGKPTSSAAVNIQSRAPRGRSLGGCDWRRCRFGRDHRRHRRRRQGSGHRVRDRRGSGNRRPGGEQSSSG